MLDGFFYKNIDELTVQDRNQDGKIISFIGDEQIYIIF